MIRVTLADADGTAKLFVGLNAANLDELFDGKAFEIDLDEAKTDGRRIRRIVIAAKATDADMLEELAPLLPRERQTEPKEGADGPAE